MTRGLAAGLGAIAFGVLSFVAIMIANPPGGTYSASDATKYIEHGHRAAVFVSVYIFLIGAVGLVLALARLRAAIADAGRASVFWFLGIAATAAWVAGYALVVAVPAASAYGGKSLSIDPSVTYTIAESGWVILYGAGGLLLGCALVAFAIGPVAVPAWVRWTTLVAGIAGLAALAWFPFFIVLIWAVVLGVWLLVADRVRAPVSVIAAA